jgi:hypothetical protein
LHKAHHRERDACEEKAEDNRLDIKICIHTLTPNQNLELQRSTSGRATDTAKLFFQDVLSVPYTLDHASRIDTKVVLIDSQLLVNLVMDFDVGVSVATAYMVKRADSDYFEEDNVGVSFARIGFR